MDVQSPRPAVGTGQVGRPETVTYREAVRTELPRVQRVEQPLAASAAAAAGDRRAGDAAARDERAQAERRARIERMADSIRESLQRRIERDDSADILVYRTVDKVTGEVVRQFPDEMILKLRAYAREMERQESKGGENHRIEKVA